MTIAFMGFFSFLISTYISRKAGKQILWPLVAIGLMSIVYWKFSGDLRLYVLVQFLPIILTPLILLLYRRSGHISRPTGKYFWLMILSYALAKVFEGYDKLVFEECCLSGHSIKHLFAALAPVWLLLGICKLK